MSGPRMAGPIRPPSWKTDELMLIALANWAGPTISLANDCRVGLSTAVTRPRAKATTYTRQAAGDGGQRRLGHQQHGPFGVTVRDHAAEQAEQQGGQELQRGGDAHRG